MKCSNPDCKKETHVVCSCGYCPDCIDIFHPESPAAKKERLKKMKEFFEEIERKKHGNL